MPMVPGSSAHVRWLEMVNSERKALDQGSSVPVVDPSDVRPCHASRRGEISHRIACDRRISEDDKV
jgi:hypothetical protein